MAAKIVNFLVLKSQDPDRLLAQTTSTKTITTKIFFFFSVYFFCLFFVFFLKIFSEGKEENETTYNHIENK